MENYTFDNLLSDYLFYKPLRSATCWSYEKVLKTFRSYVGNDKIPEKITTGDILSWRHSILNERGLSAKTWNNKVAHMRALYAFGINKKYIPLKENPFHEMVVRADTKLKKTLDDQQMEKVYSVMGRFEEMEKQGRAPGRCALLPTHFWLTVLDTLQYTGMRQNQLIHLRQGDISLKGGWIMLQAETAKNHRDYRIPVAGLLKPRLSRLLAEMKLRGMKPTAQLFNVDFCKGNSRIEVMPLQTVRGFFRRLSKECGFKVSPHRFRHTIATKLMRSPNRNLHVAKSLLGHSSANTTLEYVENDVDSLREILDSELPAVKKKGRKKDPSSGSGS
ncbi:site-specific integrase [Salmonella enterica subsp. enterica serovar Chester]|nr:site-specific integrase [Salmonella enterica subsp. enterica serovar Chester]EHZ1824058.1 site-specific integrase [Salmonella enterica subsp. enterica serovar Chester]